MAVLAGGEAQNEGNDVSGDEEHSITARQGYGSLLSALAALVTGKHDDIQRTAANRPQSPRQILLLANQLGTIHLGRVVKLFKIVHI